MFEGLAPGAFAVRAVQGANDVGPEPVWLEETDQDGLLLLLPATARIAGTVLGPDDLPVVGAEVRAARLFGDQALVSPGDGLRRATDRRGDYVFEDLAPGVWRIEARDGTRAPDVEVVHLQEDEALVLRDLEVGEGGILEGTVEDGRGPPAHRGGAPARTRRGGPGGAAGRDRAGRPLPRRKACGRGRGACACSPTPVRSGAWKRRVEIAAGETTALDLLPRGAGPDRGCRS